MKIIFFTVIAVIVFFCIPVLTSLFLFWKTRKSSYFHYKFHVASIPIVLTGIFLFLLFNPPSSFFKNDYKKVTCMEFPSSGKILDHEASFSNMLGKYTSSFVMAVSKKECRMIKDKLANQGFQVQSNYITSKELQHLEQRHTGMAYDSVMVKKDRNNSYYLVGFVKGEETIVVNSIRW